MVFLALIAGASALGKTGTICIVISQPVRSSTTDPQLRNDLRQARALPPTRRFLPQSGLTPGVPVHEGTSRRSPAAERDSLQKAASPAKRLQNSRSSESAAVTPGNSYTSPGKSSPPRRFWQD